MPADLEFTGERFLPGVAGEIAHEHWHRYAFARGLVSGKRVADVACGEGYGSALLAGTAASVIGIDIAAETIEHARRDYAALSNLRFEQASAVALPLPDASVDAVISFETIEHLPREDQPRMIAEFARALTEQGLVVLSAPNPVEYSTARNYRNPFHHHEPDRAELAALVAAAFPAQRWFRQRRYFGSTIWSESDGSHMDAWTGDATSVERAQPPLAMYFVVVAARSEASLPAGASALSLFTDRAEVELARLDQQARELLHLDGLLQERNKTLEARGERVAYLEELAAHREAQRAELVVERDALLSQLKTTIAKQHELTSSVDELRRERERLERRVEEQATRLDQLAVRLEEQTRVIAYRQSVKWWLALPWMRLKLAWKHWSGT
jgi:2-polyprenyl-3-methyl-5-hydroxy-6-metoxy-1,4-benzoquinol methylase